MAGALGTLARYGLQLLTQTLVPGSFPWGTLAVNSLGCFLFGLVWALAGERLVLSPESRITLLVGFLGAFTTWSSYIFETARMIRAAEWVAAGSNILAQHVLGFAMFFAGLGIGGIL